MNHDSPAAGNPVTAGNPEADGEPDSSVRAQVHHVEYKGTLIPINPPEALIGRSPACHLCVTDVNSSRVHAALRVVDGGLEAVDLGSMNGTRVNGARLLGPRRLRHGDLIQIGTETLRVHIRQPTTNQKSVARARNTTATNESRMRGVLGPLEVADALIQSSFAQEKPGPTALTVRDLVDSYVGRKVRTGDVVTNQELVVLGKLAKAVITMDPNGEHRPWCDDIQEWVDTLL